MKGFKYMVIDENGIVYAMSNDLLDIQNWIEENSVIRSTRENGFTFFKLDFSGKFMVIEN